MLDAAYTVVLQKRFNQQNFGVYIGKDIPEGLYVVTVEPNSPAADANVRPGDRVFAINGQLVSSISKNPIEVIVSISNKANTLTLSLLPSDILKLTGILSSEGYTLLQNKGADHDLENYLKSVTNENIQILPSLSSNQNESVLQSHFHRHRKRRSKKTIETQTSFMDEQQENNQALSLRRSIPSMGTPHVILRNAQLNSRDNGFNDIQEVQSSPNPTPPINKFAYINPAPESFSPPRQALTPSPQLPNFESITQENYQLTPQISSASSSSSSSVSPSPLVHNDGLHEVHVRRSPNFSGYGFHLQYNRVYYIIHHIEPNSPAQLAGLRPRDVILRVNTQTTDQMPHRAFIEIINSSTDVVFLVQTYDKFIRDNPEALQQPRRTAAAINNNNKGDIKRKNPLLKALTKLKSR